MFSKLRVFGVKSSRSCELRVTSIELIELSQRLQLLSSELFKLRVQELANRQLYHIIITILTIFILNLQLVHSSVPALPNLQHLFMIHFFYW